MGSSNVGVVGEGNSLSGAGGAGAAAVGCNEQQEGAGTNKKAEQPKIAAWKTGLSRRGWRSVSGCGGGFGLAGLSGLAFGLFGGGVDIEPIKPLLGLRVIGDKGENGAGIVVTFVGEGAVGGLKLIVIGGLGRHSNTP